MAAFELKLSPVMKTFRFRLLLALALALAVPTAAAALVEVVREWHRAGNWRQQWVTLRHAAVLLARAGDDRGLAILLGALAARDGGVYGADAERLTALRTDLLDRKEAAAERQLIEGGALAPVEVVDFALDRLGRLVG